MVTDNQFNPDWDQVKPFLDRIAELTAQRDELLEALHQLGVLADKYDGEYPTQVGTIARAAIAKATNQVDL